MTPREDSDDDETTLAGSFPTALGAHRACELLPSEEIPTALCEVLRVLRPGGRLGVVAVPAAGEDTLLRRLYEGEAASDADD